MFKGFDNTLVVQFIHDVLRVVGAICIDDRMDKGGHAFGSQTMSALRDSASARAMTQYVMAATKPATPAATIHNPFRLMHCLLDDS
jgi:hypothetical protein